MAMYYNSEGNMQEFQEWTDAVVCAHCGQPYIRLCEEQVPGFRDKSEDICPYCHKSNGCSMETEYDSRKMTEAEREQWNLQRKAAGTCQ